MTALVHLQFYASANFQPPSNHDCSIAHCSQQLQAPHPLEPQLTPTTPTHPCAAPPDGYSKEMSSKYAFTKSLREIRFLFCQTSEHSAATRYAQKNNPPSKAHHPLPSLLIQDSHHSPVDRSFLTRAYPTMKKNNPATLIMLREAAGTAPKVYARYGQYSPAQHSPAG